MATSFELDEVKRNVRRTPVAACILTASIQPDTCNAKFVEYSRFYLSLDSVWSPFIQLAYTAAMNESCGNCCGIVQCDHWKLDYNQRENFHQSDNPVLLARALFELCVIMRRIMSHFPRRCISHCAYYHIRALHLVALCVI